MDPISGISGIAALQQPGSAGAALGIDDTFGTLSSAGTTGGATSGGGSFVDALGDALGQLNNQLTTADASAADFAAGGSADLHTVMLEMQEASLGLKLGLQVRDSLLEAYREIMRLQV